MDSLVREFALLLVNYDVLVHARVGGKRFTEVQQHIANEDEASLVRVLDISDGRDRKAVARRPAATLGLTFLENGRRLLSEPYTTGD